MEILQIPIIRFVVNVVQIVQVVMILKKLSVLPVIQAILSYKLNAKNVILNAQNVLEEPTLNALNAQNQISQTKQIAKRHVQLVLKQMNPHLLALKLQFARKELIYQEVTANYAIKCVKSAQVGLIKNVKNVTQDIFNKGLILVRVNHLRLLIKLIKLLNVKQVVKHVLQVVFFLVPHVLRDMP